MGLEEYTGDITKERNDKEVTLYSKEKKKPHSEGERHHLQTPCTQQLKIKIAPKKQSIPF